MAEDSPSDAELARAAFKSGGIDCILTIVSDGVEAMDYMHGTDKYVDRTMPDLIILDLNMPRKDGKTVLKELKQDDRYRQIPIVILTTSQAEEDINQSYELAASCYVTKPMDFNKFHEVTKAIKNFYFNIATLPTQQ